MSIVVEIIFLTPDASLLQTDGLRLKVDDTFFRDV